MVWKEIKDFPDYSVSDTGLVRSTKYWGQFNRKDSEGLLQQRTDKAGYKFVNLYKNGHMYSRKVHRLVAEAFLPNPNNYPQINHKDEVKSNNIADNLEWCGACYNLTYNGLQTKSHLKQKRKIGGFTLEGELQLRFDSATEAALHLVETGKAKTFKSALSNISGAAKVNLQKLRYGYCWKWLEESKRS